MSPLSNTRRFGFSLAYIKTFAFAVIWQDTLWPQGALPHHPVLYYYYYSCHATKLE